MLTDHFSQSRSNPIPPSKTHFTHTDGWTDIQTDGDYIKRVVHGPPGDHTLKNLRKFTSAYETHHYFFKASILGQKGAPKHVTV